MRQGVELMVQFAPQLVLAPPGLLHPGPAGSVSSQGRVQEAGLDHVEAASAESNLVKEEVVSKPRISCKGTVHAFPLVDIHCTVRNPWLSVPRCSEEAAKMVYYQQQLMQGPAIE